MTQDKCAQHSIKISETNKKILIKLAGLKQIVTLKVESFDSVITDLLEHEYVLEYSKETKKIP